MLELCRLSFCSLCECSRSLRPFWPPRELTMSAIFILLFVQAGALAPPCEHGPYGISYAQLGEAVLSSTLVTCSIKTCVCHAVQQVPCTRRLPLGAGTNLQNGKRVTWLELSFAPPTASLANMLPACFGAQDHRSTIGGARVEAPW